MRLSAMVRRVQHPLALVFDFDGLILDTEAAAYASVAAVFAEHGAVLGLDRWVHAIGTAHPEGFWLDWLEADLGRPVNRALLQIEQRQRNEHQIRRLQIREGVTALLDAAVTAAVPCAVASSSPSRWVRPHLDRLGVLHQFAAVVTREDAARAKPAPDLYLVALDRLDVPRAAARQAVAFEDSHNGSWAAVDAGLTCITCPNDLTRGSDFSHAHHHVQSLGELRLDALHDLTAQPV